MTSNKTPPIWQKFGKLTVLAYSHKDKYGRAHWLCRCDCGKEKICMATALRRGDIRSCGCLSGRFSTPAINERNKDIMDRYNDGQTYGAIALKMDVSRNVIAGVVFRSKQRAARYSPDIEQEDEKAA